MITGAPQRGLLLALLLAGAGSAAGWEREDLEEEAGATAGFLVNPADGIYGVRLAQGVWIKHTPIFGDYSLRLFDNEIEEAWYSGVAMTLRIMPHWRVAPFVGGGGSYNHSFTGPDDDEAFDEPNDDDEVLRDRGDNYWGGHAEAGVRLWMDNRLGVLELMGRYTWSSLDGDRDYWVVGISTRPRP